jgi:integrase
MALYSKSRAIMPNSTQNFMPNNSQSDIFRCSPARPNIRKRARNVGFLTPVGCHTWHATGVTVYLENGGRLEHAQQMAAHESPRTTKLYDRTKDEITIGEVERIQL